MRACVRRVRCGRGQCSDCVVWCWFVHAGAAQIKAYEDAQQYKEGKFTLEKEKMAKDKHWV